MIAFAKQAHRPCAPSDNAKFIDMLPQIEEQAEHAFRCRDVDVRDELTHEVIANAYVAYAQLVAREKQNVAFATPLAQYAIRQVRAGRRVGSRLNVRDVMSPAARHRVRFERLDQLDCEHAQWSEVLIEDRRAGPAETAAARIDVSDWLRRLTVRLRRIACTLATGESTSGAAKAFGLTLGRISQLRQELQRSWLEFQDESAQQG